MNPLFSRIAGFFGFLILTVAPCTGQADDTLPAGPLKLYDVYCAAGQLQFRPHLLLSREISPLVPTSSLLSGDLMQIGHTIITREPDIRVAEGLYMPHIITSALYIQAGATFKLRDNEYRDVDGPWMKAGLSYFGSAVIYSGGAYKSSARIDSIGQLAGYMVQRDSLRLRTLDFSYRHESINLEATFYYQVNARGVLSMFGGAGLMAGANFNSVFRAAQTDLIYTIDSVHMGNNARAGVGYNTVSEHRSESKGTSIGAGAGIFLDVGVNLRLGQYYSPFRKMYLFGEYKPLFRVDYIPRLAPQIMLMNIWNAGIRYQFADPPERTLPVDRDNG